MNAIEMLVYEHDHILRMLAVVHQASLALLAGAPVDIKDFRKIIDFIRRYADKTHHGKEEDYLFQVMTGELGAIAEKLVKNGMLVEHDLGRLYVSDLETALNQYEITPDEEAKLAILVASGSYEQLLRRHIQKENEVVFTFAEKHLQQTSLLQVTEQMKIFEDDPQNTAERNKQLAVLDTLAAKYMR